MSATYRFLPWVRQGLATGYRPATGPAAADGMVAADPDLPLGLTVNGQANAAAVTVKLFGPADVGGIDPRAIIRREPAPGTEGFEPNYLAFVEFDDPDFPWLFTPAGADGQGRLRPWLCLIVLEQQEGVSLQTAGGRKLSVLTIEPPATPAAELPDLAESWAWAHAQAVGEADMDTGQVLSDRPAHNLSRLICPRRLASNRRYLACLVPAFEAGRLAGLGQSVTAGQNATLGPAWGTAAAAPASLDLPVYASWEFATGAGGDFESLVRQLNPQPLPNGVGVRSLQVGAPGFDLPDAGAVTFAGALRPPGGEPPAAAPPAFSRALATLLNLAGDPQGRVAGDQPPVVGPPIYGARPAAQPTVPAAGQSPVWLATLNLDPATRVAAGLGSLVVQDQQEQLMASAWDQLGDARRAAGLLHRLPFNELVLGGLFQKRVAPLAAAQVLQFAGPAQAQVRLGQATLLAHVRATDLPQHFTAAAFRMVSRPDGPLLRRLGPGGKVGGTAHGAAAGDTGAAAATTAIAVPVRRASAAALAAALVARRAQHVVMRPGGAVTPAATANRIKQVASDGRLAPPASHVDQSAMAASFLAAARQLQAYYESLADKPRPQPPSFLTALPPATLISVLDPRPVARTRVLARLSGEPASEAEPSKEALFDGLPSFPQPMSKPLIDLSQEYLLPGAGDIPAESVCLLETNPVFVEAYMVGLNHEMGRELLWREFPNDQRGTFFQIFWDTSGGEQKGAQMPPIHTWAADADLGAHLPGAVGKDVLVLLVRGQLLLRYPTAIISAVQAAGPGKLGTAQKLPLFRGRLEPDMAFLGFDLTLDAARGGNGSPGWFFVIQEQPTAPRFGLDEPPPGAGPSASLASWNDLTWADVALGPGGHISLAGRQPTVADPQGRQWNFNAAHTAAILLQRPARVAIPAAMLLPEVS